MVSWSQNQEEISDNQIVRFFQGLIKFDVFLCFFSGDWI